MPTSYSVFDSLQRNQWLEDIQQKIQNGLNPPSPAGPSRSPSPLDPFDGEEDNGVDYMDDPNDLQGEEEEEVDLGEDPSGEVQDYPTPPADVAMESEMIGEYDISTPFSVPPFEPVNGVALEDTSFGPTTQPIYPPLPDITAATPSTFLLSPPQDLLPEDTPLSSNIDIDPALLGEVAQQALDAQTGSAGSSRPSLSGQPDDEDESYEAGDYRADQYIDGEFTIEQGFEGYGGGVEEEDDGFHEYDEQGEESAGEEGSQHESWEEEEEEEEEEGEEGEEGDEAEEEEEEFEQSGSVPLSKDYLGDGRPYVSGYNGSTDVIEILSSEGETDESEAASQGDSPDQEAESEEDELLDDEESSEVEQEQGLTQRGEGEENTIHFPTVSPTVGHDLGVASPDNDLPDAPEAHVSSSPPLSEVTDQLARVIKDLQADTAPEFDQDHRTEGDEEEEEEEVEEEEVEEEEEEEDEEEEEEEEEQDEEAEEQEELEEPEQEAATSNANLGIGDQPNEHASTSRLPFSSRSPISFEVIEVDSSTDEEQDYSADPHGISGDIHDHDISSDTDGEDELEREENDENSHHSKPTPETVAAPLSPPAEVQHLEQSDSAVSPLVETALEGVSSTGWPAPQSEYPAPLVVETIAEDSYLASSWTLMDARSSEPEVSAYAGEALSVETAIAEPSTSFVNSATDLQLDPIEVDTVPFTENMTIPISSADAKQNDSLPVSGFLVDQDIVAGEHRDGILENEPVTGISEIVHALHTAQQSTGHIVGSQQDDQSLEGSETPAAVLHSTRLPGITPDFAASETDVETASLRQPRDTETAEQIIDSATAANKTLPSDVDVSVKQIEEAANQPIVSEAEQGEIAATLPDPYMPPPDTTAQLPLTPHHLHPHLDPTPSMIVEAPVQDTAEIDELESEAAPNASLPATPTDLPDPVAATVDDHMPLPYLLRERETPTSASLALQSTRLPSEDDDVPSPPDHLTPESRPDSQYVVMQVDVQSPSLGSPGSPSTSPAVEQSDEVDIPDTNLAHDATPDRLPDPYLAPPDATLTVPIDPHDLRPSMATPSPSLKVEAPVDTPGNMSPISASGTATPNRHPQVSISRPTAAENVGTGLLSSLAPASPFKAEVDSEIAVSPPEDLLLESSFVQQNPLEKPVKDDTEDLEIESSTRATSVNSEGQTPLEGTLELRLRHHHGPALSESPPPASKRRRQRVGTPTRTSRPVTRSHCFYRKLRVSDQGETAVLLVPQCGLAEQEKLEEEMAEDAGEPTQDEEITAASTPVSEDNPRLVERLAHKLHRIVGQAIYHDGHCYLLYASDGALISNVTTAGPTPRKPTSARKGKGSLAQDEPFEDSQLTPLASSAKRNSRSTRRLSAANSQTMDSPTSLRKRTRQSARLESPSTEEKRLETAQTPTIQRASPWNTRSKQRRSISVVNSSNGDKDMTPTAHGNEAMVNSRRTSPSKSPLATRQREGTALEPDALFEAAGVVPQSTGSRQRARKSKNITPSPYETDPSPSSFVQDEGQGAASPAQLRRSTRKSIARNSDAETYRPHDDDVRKSETPDGTPIATPLRKRKFPSSISAEDVTVEAEQVPQRETRSKKRQALESASHPVVPIVQGGGQVGEIASNTKKPINESPKMQSKRWWPFGRD